MARLLVIDLAFGPASETARVSGSGGYPKAIHVGLAETEINNLSSGRTRSFMRPSRSQVIFHQTKRHHFMGKADLHTHTLYSWDGTCSVNAVLKQAAHVMHLDVLAITDHDEVRGALEAEELAPRYGIEVIPGSEISTADGHLLALFIREKFQAGLPLKETVLKVREKGGLCIVPHPEAKGAPSVRRDAIHAALRDARVRETLLGIETFNAGLVYRSANARAAMLAEELPLARLGSSDAHLLWMIGQGFTRFPGHSSSDLVAAIRTRNTIPDVSETIRPVVLVLRWVRGYLLRRAGWVQYNRNPEEPVRLKRIPSLARMAPANE